MSSVLPFPAPAPRTEPSRRKPAKPAGLVGHRERRRQRARPARVHPPPDSEPRALLPVGHREPLRQRARAAGVHHLPDYELLELFLFRSQPQGDVKPIAKALLARFGSLTAVLAASVEDLMTVKAEDARGRLKGIGAAT